jgi:hypothetical protein
MAGKNDSNPNINSLTIEIFAAEHPDAQNMTYAPTSSGFYAQINVPGIGSVGADTSQGPYLIVGPGPSLRDWTGPATVIGADGISTTFSAPMLDAPVFPTFGMTFSTNYSPYSGISAFQLTGANVGIQAFGIGEFGLNLAPGAPSGIGAWCYGDGVDGAPTGIDVPRWSLSQLI